MQLRAVLFLFLLSFSVSCELFRADKKLIKQEIDTIIDFSVVDVSPSFGGICDGIIGKLEKTACFRNTIHQKFSESLANKSIRAKKSINETIYVYLLIDKQGNVSLKNVKSSPYLKLIVSNLDSLINSSLQNLPKLFPAIKRGIPVTTQYKIPIEINVK